MVSENVRKIPLKVYGSSGWDKDAVAVDPATIDWNTVGEEIGQFRLRQEPGDGNSLGRVKFSFPNRFDVYLHGTPHQELFERSSRSFSLEAMNSGPVLATTSLKKSR